VVSAGPLLQRGNLHADRQSCRRMARLGGTPAVTALLLFEGRFAETCDSGELGRLWQDLFTLAQSDDAFGCIGHSGYHGDGGCSFGVYEFRDLAGLQAFKGDERHKAVQRRASEFFTQLSIRVATVEYEYVVDLESSAAAALT
jgi:hypothetical protein